MLTEFNGQPIRQIKQDNKIWISLTDCAKASVANRSKLSEILKSNRFKEYLHTFGPMSEKSDITNSHEINTIIDDILLVITNSNKTKYELESGTWLDISSENGQDILLFIAQMLSPMFHRWCFNFWYTRKDDKSIVLNNKSMAIDLKPIIDNNKLWINLNNCAKKAGVNNLRLKNILKSEGVLAYMRELREDGVKFDPTLLLKRIASTDENDKFKRGTWLEVSTPIGRSLFLYIAQALSPKFHIWCNKHIDTLLSTGIAIDESRQIDELKAEFSKKLAKLEAGVHKQTKLARRHGSQLKKLTGELIELKEARNSILCEDDLNNAMHLLFSKCGRHYYSEFTIPCQGNKTIRLDSIRKTKFIHIIEYKLGKIDYALANTELFKAPKYYFSNIKNYFGERQIRFTFAGPVIDEISMLDFVEANRPAIGDNFIIDFCQLDKNYFRAMQTSYINAQIGKGLTFGQAQQAWERSGCAELVQSILSLAS